jgi:hypothetical protein
MKRIALTILSFVLVINLFSKNNSDRVADGNEAKIKKESINSTKLPPFNWDHVPVSAHLSIDDGLTPEQYNFLANHFDFVTFQAGGKINGSIETSIAAGARAIKQRNPEAKVLFYWSSDMWKDQWKLSNSTYPANGLLLDSKKNNKESSYYDLTRQDVRDWWSDVAAKAVGEYSCDGIFVDGAGTATIKWGRVTDQAKVDDLRKGLITMLQEAREKMGPDKLIIFNPLHGDDLKKGPVGVEYLSVADGAMMDDFDRSPDITQQDKVYLLNELEEMSKTAKDGKVVVFKGWPGFTWWSNPELIKKTHEEVLQLARKNITFPLACFLVAAQPNCYFCYTWGWRGEYGTFDWYPEFDKPLGEPSGDMVREGWKLSREYKHASVWVNLETKEAKINWKK